MAAIAIAISEVIMECAELRERPNPVLMRDNPAPASGTSRIKRKHSAVDISESAGIVSGITLCHRALVDAHEQQAPVPISQFPLRPAQTRSAALPTRAVPLR